MCSLVNLVHFLHYNDHSHLVINLKSIYHSNGGFCLSESYLKDLDCACVTKFIILF